MAQPRPKPGEVLPPLMDLLDYDSSPSSPQTPPVERDLLLELEGDVLSLHPNELKMWTEFVEEMIREGHIRSSFRRGDLHGTSYSFHRLSHQEYIEMRSYVDFLLHRSVNTRRTEARHARQRYEGSIKLQDESFQQAQVKTLRRQDDLERGLGELKGTPQNRRGFEELDAVLEDGDASAEQSSSSEE